MTNHVAVAIPGDLDTPTGGYAYDRRVIDELGALGWEVEHIPLGPSFPTPTTEDMSDAAQVLHSVSPDTPLVIDGLALGALEPSVVAEIAAPIVALIHHPLAHEGGLGDARREYLHATEQANLAMSAAVVVTSPHTAMLLQTDYGVPESAITVAEPGTDRPTDARMPSSPPLILSVGSQIRRKGHDVLVQALGMISELEWRAVVAGDARDQAVASELVELIAAHGLQERVEIPGAVNSDSLHGLYREASVFALATRFEGYGMVFSEAMTYGLPIVTCRTGAVPDTVGEGGALLVAPDDPAGMAAALTTVLTDVEVAASLASASSAAGLTLPRWEETGRQIAATLNAVMEGRS